MNCPVCEAKLRAVDRMGVEIDICPDCKGVWLDRGELEKLVELSTRDEAQPQAPTRAEPRSDEPRHEDRRDYQEHDGRDRRGHDDHGKNIDPRTGRPRRRESFLSNIFDALGGGED